jgi:hypothetical protein
LQRGSEEEFLLAKMHPAKKISSAGFVDLYCAETYVFALLEEFRASKLAHVAPLRHGMLWLRHPPNGPQNGSRLPADTEKPARQSPEGHLCKAANLLRLRLTSGCIPGAIIHARRARAGRYGFACP